VSVIAVRARLHYIVGYALVRGCPDCLALHHQGRRLCRVPLLLQGAGLRCTPENTNKTKKGPDSAAKVALEALEARGLGMGVSAGHNDLDYNMMMMMMMMTTTLCNNHEDGDNQNVWTTMHDIACMTSGRNSGVFTI